MKKFKAIYFDMGNTLLHFHHGKTDDEKDIEGVKYLTEYLRKYNSKIVLEEVKREFYDKWMEGIALRKETLTEYPIEDFLNDFLGKCNITLNLKQCIEAINAFYTEYKNQIYFEENIHKTLELIKQKGYKIGVISNTCYYDEVMLECFKHTKIYEFIDAFTFSYSLRICKPRKEIFKKALSNMNIEAQEAIMVGDNLNCDIRPALDLGMKCIWLNRAFLENTAGITPHIEISSIEEVNNYV